MSAEHQPFAYSQLIALEPQAITPHDLSLMDRRYLIGRAPDCAMVVSLLRVSRRHIQIERHDDEYLLKDLASVNGTYLNGQLVRGTQRLRNDDTIGLGEPAPLLRFVDPDATHVITRLLRLDERARCFYLNGTALNLAPLQFDLLRHLYEHAGEICGRSACAMAIWGRAYNDEFDRGAFDTAMSDLRKALRLSDASRDLIETHRGVGYLLRIV